MPTACRPHRGFSLLELIIVLLVMVGMLALVWPNLQRPLRRTTLGEAAQGLRDVIDESRYQALITGSPVFVELRRGSNHIRSGSFDSFVSVNGLQPSAGLDSAASAELGANAATRIRPPRDWRLPPSVVVAQVRWTTDARIEEDFEQASPGSATEATPISDEGYRPEPSAEQDAWWLPLLASGRGRDASIQLYDLSIQESLTVTYASATGALEIER